MKLFYLYSFVLLSLSCTQTNKKELSLENGNDSISSSDENCVDIAVSRKNNPLHFELVEKRKKDIDYGDSLVTYNYKNDILNFLYDKKKSKYNFFFNSKIVEDSAWVKWSSAFTIDIPNLTCYYFLWKGNSYYMLINSNSRASGLAANYYQIFIYDVAVKKIYDFSTMTDKPASLGVSANDEKLEFVRISFADEYYNKESTGKTPLKVETLELSSDKWNITNTRTIYCQE